MTLLADKGDPPHLVIGGDGPLREQYAQSARDRGLADHVSFAGYIPAEKLPAAYAGADVFTLPSTTATQEGFGLVALEALACETPVVTTDVIGLASELRGSEFGRVIPPGDSQALANAIRSTIDTSPDAGPGRRLCVDSYSWASSVEDLLDVYRQVTGNST
jgi:glycosyltransferase involved in cell wall biosynthesis